MSTNQQAAQSLLWVKAEIEKNLDRAEKTWREYVEQGRGHQALVETRSLIHEVRGVLRAIELNGGYLLTSEIETSLATVEQRRETIPAEALETLTRAILQLPLYLERVAGTLSDNPQVLLPLLNELRLMRGDPLLDEARLKTALLRQRVGPASTLGPSDATSVVRHVRPRYQSLLLKVYENPKDVASLSAMLELAAQIESTVKEASSFELWWAICAFLESLRDGGLELNNPRKQLLGRIDRAMRRLASSGERDDDDSRSLREAILAELRQATSRGVRVRAVQETYRHRERDEDWSASTADLSSPSYAALRTVGGAVHDDLRLIKTQLDIYQRQPLSDRCGQDLAPLAKTLRKAASTLQVLGLNVLHDELGRQAQILEEGIETPLDNERLFGVAAALLKVEDGLDEEIERLTHARALRQAGMGEPEVLLTQARSAAAREVLVNLARVRNELATISPQATELPASIDPLLGSSVSVLRFLGYEEAARLLTRLRRIMEPDLWRRLISLPQFGELFARLADAFVSIEYWLETVRQLRPGAGSLLENAATCLRALEGAASRVADASPPSEMSIPADATPPETAETTPVEPAGEAQAVDQASRTSELANAPELTAHHVQKPSVTASSAAGQVTGPSDISHPRPTRPVPTRQTAEELAIVRGDPDQELHDIFREEAQDVAGQATQALNAWRATPSDLSVVTTLRRSFHTLKGSGRLVGAERLAEFSWALENLLNLVLDGTRAVSPELIDFVAAAVATIPAFLEELDERRVVVADLGDWFEQARAFAEGREATPTTMVPAVSQRVTPKPAVEIEAEPTPRLSPDLYVIFRQEFSEHHRTLESWVQHAGGEVPPESVLRATHTISGSSHMAGVSELANLMEALDHYLWALARRHIGFDERLRPFLAETLKMGEDIVSAYGDTRQVPPDSARLVAVWQNAYERVSTSADETSTVTMPRPGAYPDEGIVGEESGPPIPSPEIREETATAAPPPSMRTDVVSTEQERTGALPEADEELIKIFHDEGQTLLEHAQQAWNDFVADPSSQEGALHAVRRDLHTIKGSARIAGLSEIGDFAHQIESLLENVDDPQAHDRLRPSDLGPLVTRGLEVLERMLFESRLGRSPAVPHDWLAQFHADPTQGSLDKEAQGGGVVVESMPSVEGSLSLDTGEGSHATAVGDGEETMPLPNQLPGEVPSPQPATGAARPSSSSYVRISAEALDLALNHAGEISIYRARLDEQMSTIGFNLLELGRTVERLRDQLRRLELETEAQMLSRLPQEVTSSQTGFDPLELDRYTRVQEITKALAESVNDVASLEQLLHNLAQESETLLVQQGRATTLVQDRLMRARLIPIASLEARLRRVVQQTAVEQGKRAVLVLRGTEAEIDRRLLERITAPLEHMVRNAVVHGLEPPMQRQQAGKSEVGTVSCEFHREGSEVLIEVRDDGRGMDYEAIRRRAEALKLIQPGQPVGEAELLSFIFRTGFTTAETVTQNAGRGVGMDIVASEIRDLAGTIDIETQRGKGTTIRIRLPFTLAITQALLVAVRGYTFAVPLTSIEGVARLPIQEYHLIRENDESVWHYGGRDYRLETLAGLMLGDDTWQPTESAVIPLLLVRAGHEHAALAIDAIEGHREIVVKPVGAQVASIAGISGATILGDGSIVLVLDSAGLVRVARRPASSGPEVPVTAPQRALVLIVDDSITMRRVTQRLLERHGLEVLTAKDGVDALALLAERIPDAVLVDIEMPRMDGFELTGHIRRDERLRTMPVIMITSRTGEKHRDHARTIGVDAYLSKPYREEELLDTLGHLVPRLVHLRQGRAS